MTEQKNNPLHGLTLETIVTRLVEYYGWDELGERINIPLLSIRSKYKIQFKVFAQNTLGARKSRATLFEHTLSNIIILLSQNLISIGFPAFILPFNPFPYGYRLPTLSP